MDSRNENRRLIGQYPFLLPWGTDSANFESTELDAMPAGWRIAFGEKLCKEIMEELTRNNCVDSYRVVQIKEKHGALRWYAQGGMTGHSYDPANPMKPEDLDEPGMILYFDEAEAEKLRDLLDNRCGTSVMDTLPPALDAIVREEVSAFLAGMGTAEDCAGKIQSRVNLWLSEQK